MSAPHPDSPSDSVIADSPSDSRPKTRCATEIAVDPRDEKALQDPITNNKYKAYKAFVLSSKRSKQLNGYWGL